MEVYISILVALNSIKMFALKDLIELLNWFLIMNMCVCVRAPVCGREVKVPLLHTHSRCNAHALHDLTHTHTHIAVSC